MACVGVGEAGWVATLIFMSNATTVLRLCCVVVGFVTIPAKGALAVLLEKVMTEKKSGRRRGKDG